MTWRRSCQANGGKPFFDGDGHIIERKQIVRSTVGCCSDGSFGLAWIALPARSYSGEYNGQFGMRADDWESCGRRGIVDALGGLLEPGPFGVDCRDRAAAGARTAGDHSRRSTGRQMGAGLLPKPL